MSFELQNNEIRERCKALLEEQKVDIILAYTGGGVEDMLIPYFARTPEDIQRIQWGDRCYQHLAPYLHGRTDRVGILAKPCDARAIVQYLIEGQLQRENVYIIGIDCPGMVDAAGDSRPGCAQCDVRTPPLYDAHIADDRVSAPQKEEQASSDQDLLKNLEKFQKEIDKCILCYSCRQACYGCYCQTCFVERGTPDWQPSEIDAGTKMAFHLGRAMHLAGRCVQCGACEAACASGVNIRYIINEVTNFVGDEYGYRTGMDLETTSAMLTYTADDEEIGFLGGAQHE